MSFIATEIIEKKKRGQELDDVELQEFFGAYLDNRLPDYQMAAFLMASWFEPLTPRETRTLTRLMKSSGESADFSKLQKPVVDKHSTGGIGDKTSLILNPLLAAAGLAVPMMAGRGLSFTGGTLDKLESIDGFNVNLNLSQFKSQVEQKGFALIGQTSDICPLDKKLYALRDVTGTVDSIPLICASILSKKIAEGAQYLVMDVKFGSGAFMKDFEQAKNLARALIEVGQESRLKISALLTNMNQPLGAFVGNALEVHECLEILQGKKRLSGDIDLYEDTRRLTLELGAEALLLTGLEQTKENAIQTVERLIQSGQAFEKFCELCRLQGADSHLPRMGTKFKEEIVSRSAGFLSQFDGEQIGLALIELGGGRLKHEDTINHRVGIEVRKKISQQVEREEPIFVVHADDKSSLKLAAERLEKSYQLSENEVSPLNLIAETLRSTK